MTLSILAIFNLVIFFSSVQCANNYNFSSAFNANLPENPNSPTKTFGTKSLNQPQQPLNFSQNISPFYNSNGRMQTEWNLESNGANNSVSNNTGWFPNLTENNTGSPKGFDQNFYTGNNNSNSSNTNPFKGINSDFQEKLALTKAKNYLISSIPLGRDLKLLSLAHEFLFSAISSSSRPLNILHLGSGTGYVSIALAVFSRPFDTIVSLDDKPSNIAKENIYRDGKEIFLNRLKFNQVTNFSTSLIPRAPNNLPYDLIVSSLAINPLTSIPRSLKESLVPRGIIIYPDEVSAGNFNRRIKVDKLDEYGNFHTIKTAEL